MSKILQLTNPHAHKFPFQNISPVISLPACLPDPLCAVKLENLSPAETKYFHKAKTIGTGRVTTLKTNCEESLSKQRRKTKRDGRLYYSMLLLGKTGFLRYLYDSIKHNGLLMPGGISRKEDRAKIKIGENLQTVITVVRDIQGTRKELQAR